MIAVDKNITQCFILTFILLGYPPSSQELSNRPCQHVLGHKQCADKQRKAMLGEWLKWVPYPSFNPTVHLLFPRAKNIRVDSDPCAREYGYEATPNDIPNSPTMREVGTTIWIQREFVEGWDGVGVNRLGGSLNQVVDEDEKYHREG